MYPVLKDNICWLRTGCSGHKHTLGRKSPTSRKHNPQKPTTLSQSLPSAVRMMYKEGREAVAANKTSLNMRMNMLHACTHDTRDKVTQQSLLITQCV